MSNALYNIARRAMALGTFEWTAWDLLLLALDDTPVYDPTDATVTAVLAHGAAKRGTSLAITGAAVTADGTCQTDPVVLPGITVGTDVTHFLLVRSLGSDATNTPILFIDTTNDDQLPFVPNGEDLTVQPDWLLERGWFRP